MPSTPQISNADKTFKSLGVWGISWFSPVTLSSFIGSISLLFPVSLSFCPSLFFLLFIFLIRRHDTVARIKHLLN